MIPKSNEIRIEVTTKCNYNCIICPRGKLTRKLETMDYELFRLVFDRITGDTAQYNVLSFPGMGEPLLDPTLNSKIEYAKKKHFNVNILTNASLLSLERFMELQNLGVDSIRVSMYGLTRETYSAVHGIENKLMFDRIKENLLAVIEARKHTQILFTYNVIEGVNDMVLNDWIDFWKDKVDLLEVWKPHNWGNSMHFRKAQEKKAATCGRPFNSPLQVQVDGTVNMCCFDFNGELLLGDLKKQSLHEIFDSPAFHKIRSCHLSGNYEKSGLICEHCDQRNADKDGIMIYNSKFDIKSRVNLFSTNYSEIDSK